MTATQGGKIFGIGLPRTGTSSLVRALSLLGIPSIHHPAAILTDPDHPLLEKYQGFADIPVPVIWRELDRRFPGSKFILTERDLDAWLASVRWMLDVGRRWGGWDRNPTTVAMHRALYGDSRFDEALFRSKYLRHRAEILEYFAERAGDLLVMDCTRGQGWDVLCPFLGRPVPDAPFPHENRRHAAYSLLGLGWRIVHGLRRIRRLAARVWRA